MGSDTAGGWGAGGRGWGEAACCTSISGVRQGVRKLLASSCTAARLIAMPVLHTIRRSAVRRAAALPSSPPPPRESAAGMSVAPVAWLGVGLGLIGLHG